MPDGTGAAIRGTSFRERLVLRSPSDETPYEPPPIGPPPLSAALLGFVLLVVLVSNGRPIGSADARPTERVAATLAQHGRLDLDDYPDVEEPFARTVGCNRAGAPAMWALRRRIGSPSRSVSFASTLNVTR